MKEMLKMTEQTIQLCRLCSKDGGTVSIFDFNGAVRFSEQAMRSAEIKILIGDGLPQEICLNCCDALSTCYTFRLMCEQSDQLFRLKLSENFENGTQELKTKNQDRVAIIDEILTKKKEHAVNMQDKKNIQENNSEFLNVGNEYNTRNKIKYPAILDNHKKKRKGLKTNVKIAKKRKIRTNLIVAKDENLEEKGDLGIECNGVVLKTETVSDVEDGFGNNVEENPCVGSSDDEKLFDTAVRLNLMKNGDDWKLNKDSLSKTTKTRKKIIRCPNCGERVSKKEQISSTNGSTGMLCRKCRKPIRMQHSRRLRPLKPETISEELKEEPPDYPNDKTDENEQLNIQTHSSKIEVSELTDTMLDVKLGGSKYKLKTLARVLRCGRCSKVFRGKGHLQRHLLKDKCVLEETRSHMCDVCGNTFKHRSVLLQHMRTHSGLKQFSCELCRKRFTRTAHLAAHLRIHNNVKPFVCETCGRSFTKSSDLNRHRRIHSDARNYSCCVCERTFKRSGDVASHMRSHTGDRPYKCLGCNKSYTTHSSLQKHKRTHLAAQNKDLEAKSITAQSIPVQPPP